MKQRHKFQSERRTNASFPTVRIGFLPFYVDYYEGVCPDFPREKAANARRCANFLSTLGEVVWDGELIRNADAAASLGRKLEKENLDCVIVFTSIAVFGQIPWSALQHLTCPILIWNAQQIQTVGKDYTMVEIVRNTGQIGTQALANTLLREGRWFRIVTGWEKSKRTAVELRRYIGIVRAVSAVKRARLLAIGEKFPMMTDILLDEADLARNIGATVVNVGNKELSSRYVSVPEEAVQRACSALRKENQVEELSEDEAQRSMRLCEAVASLVAEHRADAGTLNCHAGVCLRNPLIGITACYSLGVQNAMGRPFTCTGDLPTAIAMLMLKNLSGLSMYTEVQVMDEKRRAIVIANSGEGEDGIRRGDCQSRIIGNKNFKGVHGCGASFAYPLKPGLATIVSFTPSPKGAKPYRLIVAEGEILKEMLPDAGGLAGFFQFAHTDLHTGYTRWLEAGAVHHGGTTTGHWARELAVVADLLGVECIQI
jgi:L-arabinose isomerase